MKFLTKLGQILVKATQIISGAGALFPQYNPQITKTKDTLELVAGIVMNVEVFGQVLGTPGADKLKAAAPLVAQVIMQSDMLVKRKIQDAALFQKGAEQVAAGMADVLNSLKSDVETSDVVA